jgi:hypothetical protein
MGCGAIPIGGLEDFYQLCKEEEWTLPFELWGYYDLRQTHGHRTEVVTWADTNADQNR